MPAPDFSAIARWPDVPDCFGWLGLDRRGRWRLRGETISHPGLVAFIARQYAVDAAGRAFFQNGPQRVFVDLDYTPWVWRLQADDSLLAHTGEAAGDLTGVFGDDEGNVLLQTALGIGVLDDRDLGAFVGECCGELPDAATWRGLAVQRLRRAEVPSRFGFVAMPRA